MSDDLPGEVVDLGRHRARSLRPERVCALAYYVPGAPFPYIAAVEADGRTSVLLETESRADVVTLVTTLGAALGIPHLVLPSVGKG